MIRLNPTLILLSALLLLSAGGAQSEDRHYPLHHRQPAGMAGRWSVIARPQLHGYIQPVRVTLPSQGHVTFYAGSPQNRVLTQSPSDVGMMVGHVYRFRISGLPEFPGAEFFPTVEILDRMHPPPGHLHEFPVPIEISEEELAIVLQDRMVTKVIYVEQPDRAQPADQGDRILVEDLSPNVNLLKAADRRGRPMAILRLGGRIPDPTAPADEFHSQSPILIPQQ